MFRFQRSLFVWAALSILAACSGDAPQPTAPSRPSFSRITTPLPVTLSGLAFLESGGIHNMTATATGGSGKYKFRWRHRICNRIGTQPMACEIEYINEGNPITTTGGTSVDHHNFFSSDVKTWFVVEVQDSLSVEGPSGADSMLVIGPAAATGGHSGGSTSMVCNLGSFPLFGDTSQSDTVKLGPYRRNPCSGQFEPGT